MVLGDRRYCAGAGVSPENSTETGIAPDGEPGGGSGPGFGAGVGDETDSVAGTSGTTGTASRAGAAGFTGSAGDAGKAGTEAVLRQAVGSRGSREGWLEIYISADPEAVLLPYERRLVRAVAHQLGTVIEKKRAEEHLTRVVSLLEQRNRELERKSIALQELLQISGGLGRSGDSPGVIFTVREHEIAAGIRDGKSTKDLADQLGLSEATVEKHRYNIRRKLGLTGAGQNLQSYLRRGWFGRT